VKAKRIEYGSVPWKSVRNGQVKYKPIAIEGLGASLVSFDPGVGEPPHSHDETQIVFCLEGHIEMFVKDEDGERTESLRSGDVLAMQKGVIHGAKAVEKTLALVVWNPMLRFMDDSVIVS